MGISPVIASSNRAIFCDRDGVINELVYYSDSDEYESPRTPADFVFLPNAIAALRQLKAQGWTLLLVSNQPSYAKGKTSLENLHAVHALMHDQLQAHDIPFAQYYYCYHHPAAVVTELRGDTEFRKPNAGYLLLAQQQYHLDLASSWMVGDRDSDVLCGQRAGCETAQITYLHSRNHQGHSSPGVICSDLFDFARHIRSAL